MPGQDQNQNAQPTVTSILADPNFQNLSLDGKRQILSKVDPSFTSLSNDGLNQFLSTAQQKGLTPPEPTAKMWRGRGTGFLGAGGNATQEDAIKKGDVADVPASKIEQYRKEGWFPILSNETQELLKKDAIRDDPVGDAILTAGGRAVFKAGEAALGATEQGLAQGGRALLRYIGKKTFTGATTSYEEAGRQALMRGGTWAAKKLLTGGIIGGGVLVGKDVIGSILDWFGK